MRSIGSAAILAAIVAERAAHDSLVRPARPRHDRDRAVVAIERRELRHDLVERVDGEMDRERGAGGGERGQRLACGMREARPAIRVSTTVCAISGKVSSRPSAAAAAAKAGTPGVSV